jgi:hypothetical protein
MNFRRFIGSPFGAKERWRISVLSAHRIGVLQRKEVGLTKAAQLPGPARTSLRGMLHPSLT